MKSFAKNNDFIQPLTGKMKKENNQKLKGFLISSMFELT